VRYVLDFGNANAGATPAFDVFKNADTLADESAPALVESGEGLFYFDYAWASPSITSILYKASINGVELSDVISSTSTAAGPVAVGSGAGVNPWLWTAGQILNTAATEAGLAEAPDPYASTNAYFVQMRTLLKTAGDEISKVRDWTVMLREAIVTGDGTTKSFALPSDFLRMSDDSGWNRSTALPLALTSSQQWQTLKARVWNATVVTRYRWMRGRIEFYEAPPAGASLAFEYVSRYWVASDGAAAADAYFPAASGDRVMFEPLMVMRLVKAKFLQAKGFDSSGAFAEYQQALNDAANLEPAPSLSLGGARTEFYGFTWPRRIG
jgi:enamine deaminase RidA (YjgF/YER057c/UK114 family)